MVADDTLPKARLLGSVRVWDRRDLDAALDDLPLADRPNEWDRA
jgi:hypothetical protein